MARKPAVNNKKAQKKEESESATESIESAGSSSSGADQDVNETTSSAVNSEDAARADELVGEVEVSEESDAKAFDDERAVDEPESGYVSEETQSGSNDEAALDDETMRTIFMKGLDYDTTEEEIRQEMEKIGPVGRVHVPLTHDSRRNKGFAYVEFKKLIDAKKGLKLNDSTFLGRKIVVDQAKPKTNFMLYTVFCKNLSFDTKKEELLEHFNKFGKVHNLSLPMDTENEGRNRGYCFVEYTNEEIARKAIEEKHVINKRHLYCNLGNKNEERNVKRGGDRLYGRRDGPDRGTRQYDRSDRDARPYDRDSRPFNRSRNFENRNGDRSNKRKFDDDE